MSIFGIGGGGGAAAGAVPPPPPPPQAPPSRAAPSVLESGASERASLAAGAGKGFSGTDVTGGQGAKAPSTTKSLLGG